MQKRVFGATDGRVNYWPSNVPRLVIRGTTMFPGTGKLEFVEKIIRETREARGRNARCRQADAMTTIDRATQQQQQQKLPLKAY
jgi:hypothetical protein